MGKSLRFFCRGSLRLLPRPPRFHAVVAQHSLRLGKKWEASAAIVRCVGGVDRAVVLEGTGGGRP